LGNLCQGRLSVAWTAAAACLGSVHLFFDKELLSDKIVAAACDSGIKDDAQHCVPISGNPLPAHRSLAAAEKQESQVCACAKPFGKNLDCRCLQDSITSFSKCFKTPEKNMSVAKWRHHFGEASSKGTLIAASGYGRQLRAFGSNLALSSPRSLFMAHEWVSATHLRPQVHSLAWFAAVETFGPLWLHQDALVDSVVETMNSGKIAEDNDSDDESETVEVVDNPSPSTGNIHQPSYPMAHAEPAEDTDVDDDSSAVTQDAGTNQLVQQRMSGKHRTHQLRYDVRLHVAPSEEADKSMIAAAKTFFSKANEMDKSLVICPWFKKSINPNIKNVGSILDQMGASKQCFHQAQPKVAHGFLHMRLWLGLDKDPKLLEEDLRWWLKLQNFGMHPRSVQAENISGSSRLLCSAKEVDCAALQSAIEKKLGNKFEVGCRCKMISLGRRVQSQRKIKSKPFTWNAILPVSSALKSCSLASAHRQRTTTTQTEIGCDWCPKSTP
jgi:hypothetical protein